MRKQMSYEDVHLKKMNKSLEMSKKNNGREQPFIILNVIHLYTCIRVFKDYYYINATTGQEISCLT